jgi:hypothetical protein
MFMKTFEEKYTAWLDGVLEGTERAVFENEFPHLQQDKAEMLKLSGLLKETLRQPELTNPDFFNAQILKQIDQETKVSQSWWRQPLLGLPRFAWGGIVSAGVAAGICLVFVAPHFDKSKSSYMAQVLQTKTRNPGMTATVDNRKDMTVIELQDVDPASSHKETNKR